jgi:hypothetical protein
MTDDDRYDLYMALLRGLAKTAQDRLCAADEHHDWGPWRRYEIRHDDSDVPLAFDPAPMKSVVVKVAAERKCQNCGKEQTAL